MQKRADESANVMVVAQYLAREEPSEKENPLHLRFRLWRNLRMEHKVDLLVLLDTGAEVNIIKKSLVPSRRVSDESQAYSLCYGQFRGHGRR